MTTPDHLASVLALLRDFEWALSNFETEGDECPVCRADMDAGHKLGCRLAATIRALEAQEAEPQPATAEAIRREALEEAAQVCDAVASQTRKTGAARKDSEKPCQVTIGEMYGSEALAADDCAAAIRRLITEPPAATDQPSPVTAAEQKPYRGCAGGSCDRDDGITCPDDCCDIALGLMSPPKSAAAPDRASGVTDDTADAFWHAWCASEKDGRPAIRAALEAVWPTPAPAGSRDVEAENRVLREALRPFAEACEAYPWPDHDDGAPIDGDSIGHFGLRLRDFRRARAALAASGADDEGGRR